MLFYYMASINVLTRFTGAALAYVFKISFADKCRQQISATTFVNFIANKDAPSRKKREIDLRRIDHKHDLRAFLVCFLQQLRNYEQHFTAAHIILWGFALFCV